MPIQQPANQIKLTNVSLVRYKKGKKRFELACYKNKLLEYRSGTETDLDNVLQVPTIFLNASKGETAPNAELVKAWPMPSQNEKQESGGKGGGRGGKKGKGKSTTDEGDDEKSWKDAIIEEILKKGEIQVNANERKELLDRMEREIVEEVAQRLVDPQTKRVYTTGMIKKGLDVLSKQGGHVPSQDSLGHKLGKLNLGEGIKKGAAAPKGSSETSGQATPMTDDDNESASGGNSKGKKSDMPTWTGVVTNKSVKQQALEAIRALITWQPIPVMRARMRLRVTCPTNIAKQAAKSKAASTSTDAGEDAGAEQGKGTIKDRILSFVEQVESQEVLGEEWEVVGFVEPGAFKALGEFIAAEMKGRGRLEVLDMAVTHTDD
ncbi:SBD protein domain-containing protein isoform 2 [Cladophialophora immunda]|nr:SBD protein domain-containing protein isoform 2 [Cladophialophora immunda]